MFGYLDSIPETEHPGHRERSLAGEGVQLLQGGRGRAWHCIYSQHPSQLAYDERLSGACEAHPCALQPASLLRRGHEAHHGAVVQCRHDLSRLRSRLLAATYHAPGPRAPPGHQTSAAVRQRRERQGGLGAKRRRLRHGNQLGLNICMRMYAYIHIHIICQ